MNMTRDLLITLSSIGILFGACREHAYYQSAFHGNNSSYKVMPAHADRPVSEIHADGSLYTGGSGDKLRDGSWGMMGSLYRSHSLGIIRGFYGLTGALGSYRVRTIFSESPGKYPTDSIINARAGSKFFAGVGGTAGFYLTNNFRDGGEWRFIGIELNYQREFGRYLSFRQGLHDTAVNMVDRSADFFTIGLHTDLNAATRHGFAGFKLGAVFSTNTLTRHANSSYSDKVLPGYFSLTYHFTRERITGYWQANVGTYVINTMAGISYRLH